MAAIPSIQTLLGNMKTHEASDLHLKAGMPPVYRVGGHLRILDLPKMSGDDIDACMTPIIPPKRRDYYEEFGDLDFAHELEDGRKNRPSTSRS